MSEKDEQAPFPREPWRRLLEDSSEVPPETTDARIRAAARRDLAPRGQRWWLPASLAASFVLAVMIVRSEFGSIHGPAVTESERAGGEAMSARIIDRNAGPEAREKGESAATAPLSKAVPQERATEQDEYGYRDEETGSDADAAGASPRVGGPERELRSASEAPEERMTLRNAPASTPAGAAFAGPAPAPAAAPQAVSSEDLRREGAREDKKAGAVVVTGSRAPKSQAPSAWTPSHVAAPVDNTQPRSSGTYATPPTPEAWYDAIEKLRAQGRTTDADRELEKLKKAYPGWLERHLEKQKKP